MDSSGDENCSLVHITEQETLGEARKRRALPLAEGRDGDPALGKVKTGTLASKSNNWGKSKAIKSAKGRDASKGKGKGRGRGKGKGERRSERKSRNGRSTVTGLLGLPIHWGEEDSDYDDSEDETYKPTPSPSSSIDASATRITITKNSTSSSRTACRKRGSPATTRKEREKGQQHSRASLTSLSPEVALNSIIRPYLCAASKCALQRTCNNMRELIDTPEAWQSLDLRAGVIGRRTMRSGRQSILSNQPLFFLARSVIQQSRFSRLTTVDLRGLNLGAMGSAPDLLVTLFKTCSSITKLNLWKTFVEDATLPQPESAVEKVIADNLPGVEHLALEIDASNKALMMLLEGCRRLKSLHIGSRCSSRMGDSLSMYPNDLGMKAFAAVGAPCLETLSFVDKINIGAAGLRCVLDASCPRLKSLILIRSTRITDRCLKALAPEMGRITSLTLDRCPIKPATVRMVIERCPQLSRLVVCTGNGVLENPQEGRPLLNMILARGSAKLTSVDLQRASESIKGAVSAPPWLLGDAVLHKAVLDSHSPRIAIGFAETPDDRISPFMALIPSKE